MTAPCARATLVTMTAQTLVTIYEVTDDTGDTASQVATGTLVHPGTILVHSPVSGSLLRTPSPRLRVGVASVEAASGVVEVIEVKEVLVSEQPGDPLVALNLKKKAVSPIEVLPGEGDAAEVIQAVRGYLSATALDRRASKGVAPSQGPDGGANATICCMINKNSLCCMEPPPGDEA